MKNLIVFFFLVCSLSTLNAQNLIIIRGGINLASQNDFSIGSANLKGATVALANRTNITDNFIIQSEISLVQKGNTILGTGSAFNTTLNYVEIPVLAAYAIVNDSYLGVDLFAGPSIGYGLSGTIEETGGASESFNWDEAGIKRSDFSLVFGAATYFTVAFSSKFAGILALDVRYLHGLSNIADETNNPTKIKNRGLAISLGYVIPLKGE